jgi:hypothetical protein
VEVRVVESHVEAVVPLKSGTDSQTGFPIEWGIDQRCRADSCPSDALGRDNLCPVFGGPFPHGPEKRVGKQVSTATTVHCLVAYHGSCVVALNSVIFSPSRGYGQSQIAILGWNRPGRSLKLCAVRWLKKNCRNEQYAQSGCAAQ